MQTGGYIKLHRQITEWEWYSDRNTRDLFIHCLLKANWAPVRWNGELINRGEFVTSLPKLSAEVGLTVQQARTSLSKLKSTGEITDRSTSKYRVITIKNYDLYQADNRQNNSQITGNQQAEQQQYKNIKNKKNNNRARANKFNNFDQRENDYGELQKQLSRQSRGSNGKRVPVKA